MTFQRAWAAIAAERIRQQTEEGFDAASDDRLVLHQLVRAATAYEDRDPSMWPWGSHTLKFRSRRKDLLRAGALHLAEADRLVRQANRHKEAARRIAEEIADLPEEEG